MSLSLNDIQTRPWTRAVATGSAVVTGPVRLMAMSLTHTAAAGSMIAYNNTAQSGTDLVQLRCVADTTAFVTFGPNGTLFGTGLSITIAAGAGAVFYIAE